MAKIYFEEWLWNLACAEIKHICSGIEIFAADVSQDDFVEKLISDFSRFCAHHQNAHPEHDIKTIKYMARTFIS